MSKFRLTFLVMLFISASETPAAPITFFFSGSLDAIFDPLNQLPAAVTVGTPFQGHYTFNPNVADSNALATLAQYRSTGAEYEYVATVGGMTFTRNGTAGPSGIEIVVGDNNAGLDVYQVQDATGVLTNGPDFSTIGDVSSGIILNDGDQTALSSTALPLAPPSLAPFNDSASSPYYNANFFSMRALLTNGSILFTVSGPVTQIAVPEPSTLLTCSSGLIAAVFAVQRLRPRDSLTIATLH
jgi:hypothetical protein